MEEYLYEKENGRDVKALKDFLIRDGEEREIYPQAEKVSISPPYTPTVSPFTQKL